MMYRTIRNAAIVPFYFFNKITASFQCCCWEGNDMRVEVYCAKQMGAETWNSNTLKEVVAQTRAAYQRYGSVALFDEHDRWAAIYVARTLYQEMRDGNKCLIEEWVSMRFVSGNSSACVPEDFDLFTVAGIPLVSYVQSERYDYRSVLSRSVSLSRLCATEPMMVGDHCSIVLSRRRSVALAFMLINRCFFEQCTDRIEFVTGIMRDELRVSLMRGSRVDSLWRDSFPLADDFLWCNPCDVALNRRNETTYRFPGYFLHTRDMRRTLVELIETDRISCATLSSMCGFSCSLSMIKESFRTVVPKLGALLSAREELPYASVSAEYLRRVFDLTVADGPRLYIGYRDIWTALVQRSLRALDRYNDTETNVHCKHTIPALYAPAFA